MIWLEIGSNRQINFLPTSQPYMPMPGSRNEIDMINLETILLFEYKIKIIVKPHKRRRALTIKV